MMCMGAIRGGFKHGIAAPGPVLQTSPRLICLSLDARPDSLISITGPCRLIRL